MVIYKPMVGVGIFLIIVGIYGVTGFVEDAPNTPFPRRGRLTGLLFSKFGQDFGPSGGKIALGIGGIMIIVGAIGWFKSRDEPEEPGFFS